jgi:hypothetical protein
VSMREGHWSSDTSHPECGLDSQGTWSSGVRVTGGSERAPSDSYTFRPTNTSTVAWSSRFHVASPIHMLSSPPDRAPSLRPRIWRRRPVRRSPVLL